MQQKKRKPRPVLNPIALLSVLRPTEVRRILTHYYVALDNLMAGRGGENDLYTLLKVCELMYIALKSGRYTDVDSAVAGVVTSARGIRGAVDRVEAGKPAGLDGGTYQTIKDVLAQTENMFSDTSIAVVKRWLAEQKQSIRSGVFQCLNHDAPA
jgi:hypothetical protein